MKRLLVTFFLMLVPTTYAYARDIVVIGEDRGGRIGDYVDKYQDLKVSGAMIKLFGLCASACTIVLGAIPKERVCVTTKTRFGFHAAWDLDGDGHAVTNLEATRMLYAMYPSLVKRYITARGGLTSHMIYIKGTELGYRLCGPNDQTFAQAR